MIRRVLSLFKKKVPPPRADGFDAIIAERQTRYDQLRDGLLQLLFVQAKLRAEVGPRSSRLAELQSRIQTLGDEMSHCRAEMDELRRCRLDAAAEVAFLQAV